MPTFALFFLFGTLLVQWLPQLQPIWLLALFLLMSIIMTLLQKKISRIRRYFPSYFLSSVTAFFFGSIMATLTAQNIIDNRLPNQWEGKEILLQGVVQNLPKSRAEGVRFRFKIIKAFVQTGAKSFDRAINFKGKVRLAWYRNYQMIKAGESWQLKVRMKRPAGFLNPGGFDYEKWLFSERIIATGYVRKSSIDENKLLAQAPWWSINHLRQNIHESIQATVEDKSAAAVISALVVAHRGKLNNEQWEDLKYTGTSHLIAISGLHIAVVAGFAFLPIMLIWWFFPKLNEKVPLRIAGGIAGVVFATVYALLAGFTLPTQRALLMVLIGLFGLMLRQNYSSLSILASALLGVLLLDPLAAMTISFWLSFLAVALILIILKRQSKQPIFQLIKLQIILSFGMLPLTLLFFDTASLSSPLANLFAIPWLSFVVVPLSLLGLLFMPLFYFVSDALFNLSALAITGLFGGLHLLSDLPINHYSLAGGAVLYLVLAFLGFLFLLLPKGFPARWLGLVAFLPAIFFTVNKPQQGAFSYTLLDAGQGMASVIHTKNHTLIYDTGTRMSDSFDIGKLVLMPYLKNKRVQQVDMMILSHDDIDHTGGANTVISNIEVKQVLGSQISRLKNKSFKNCEKGMHWQWDGVEFEILSPSLADLSSAGTSDNNLSCVLRVSNGQHSLLLTGDIEHQIENDLLNSNYKLASNVLSVPHHGSRTSSSSQFISAVSPQLALVPVGYRNRFGHPKADIVSRYADLNIKLMDTVNHGAIEVAFPNNLADIQVTSFRAKNRGFWSR